MDEVMVKWNIGRRRQKNDPRYVYSEVIQLIIIGSIHPHLYLLSIGQLSKENP